MSDDEFDFDELEDLASNPAKLWAPREIPEGKDEDECITDKLVFGVVEDYEIRTGDYEPFPWLMLRRRDGSRVSVYGYGQVLINRLSTVKAGDGLVIEYLGSAHSKEKDADYANFRVEHKRVGVKDASALEVVPDENDDEEGGQDAASV